MSDGTLDYGKLLKVLEDVEELGDKVFHPSTVHKPEVWLMDPTVRDNVATFSVIFRWPFTAKYSRGSRLRWTRGKNITQLLSKLNKAGKDANLVFGADWNEVEFSIEETFNNNRTTFSEVPLLMCVSFTVTAATPEQWSLMEKNAAD